MRRGRRVTPRSRPATATWSGVRGCRGRSRRASARCRGRCCAGAPPRGVGRGRARGGLSSLAMTAEESFGSVAEVKASLGEVDYLADEPAALVSFLAQRLGKPVLVEGPAGVGKTELAKALSRATGRELIRLQCYEGLDEAKSLYEWNYRKQLLRIQAGAAESEASGWDAAHDDIFSEEFLLTR